MDPGERGALAARGAAHRGRCHVRRGAVRPEPVDRAVRRRRPVDRRAAGGPGGHQHPRHRTHRTAAHHHDDPATQSAPAHAARAVGTGHRHPLPALGQPGRGGRRLVRRHPAVRHQGRAGRRRRRRPRHPAPRPPGTGAVGGAGAPPPWGGGGRGGGAGPPLDLPPDELLSHLDDLVVHLSAEEGDGDGEEAAGGVGTTCLYGVYDPVTRRLDVARAGHPPPAVVTEGAVTFLDVPAGPPLGLGGLPFESFETELPEGSVIALYTNGLLEPRDHDIDDALDKMFAALARPAQSLDTVCDRVLTSMLTHRPDDDIALLVARTHALHADRVATWELPFDLAAVAEARKQATDQLVAWRLEDAAFITELIVSELVTNAFRYGRPPVRLRLIHDDHALTCEVFDSSSTAPHMRRAHTYDEGGRGLLLVGQLSQRWGTRHASTGKTVWAEQFLTED
ncbi:SpoIIE family protein phosphatase [Streptomyces sp. NPDC127079]|uniref:SpoIIE family protein phosphatase n=1 Tax=Streptomyces sp. NPDC127079 TaxID=3347132 RepID=UPI00364CF418